MREPSMRNRIAHEIIQQSQWSVGYRECFATRTISCISSSQIWKIIKQNALGLLAMYYTIDERTVAAPSKKPVRTMRIGSIDADLEAAASA